MALCIIEEYCTLLCNGEGYCDGCAILEDTLAALCILYNTAVRAAQNPEYSARELGLGTSLSTMAQKTRNAIASTCSTSILDRNAARQSHIIDTRLGILALLTCMLQIPQKCCNFHGQLCHQQTRKTMGRKSHNASWFPWPEVGKVTTRGKAQERSYILGIPYGPFAFFINPKWPSGYLNGSLEIRAPLANLKDHFGRDSLGFRGGG